MEVGGGVSTAAESLRKDGARQNLRATPRHGGTNAALSLPLNLPHSTLVDAIQSPRVRALLTEEQALRSKRIELRDRLHTLQSHRDGLVRESADNSELRQVSTAMTELHREKDMLYSQLEQLRVEQDELAQARSAVRLCSFECNDTTRAVHDAALLLESEQKELQRARGNREDAQKLQSLEAAVLRYTEQHAARQAEREAKEVQREEARQRLEALSGGKSAEARHETYQQLTESIAKVQAQLDALRGKRQAATRTTAQPVEQIRREEAELRATLRITDDRLAAIRATELPFQKFSYPVEYRGELIGTQGTTLSQLQVDFGAALCVDGVPSGLGFVIGSTEAMRDCVDAIDAIMDHAQRHSESRELVYDVSKRQHLIGPRGATIDRIERDSGARVRLQRDGFVDLKGTVGALDRAQRLVEAIMDSFSTGEISFDANKIGTVIGQGGATIQRVEKASGLRTIRVDRAQSKILLSGSREAIVKAKALYQDVLGVPSLETAGTTQAAETTAVIHVDERVVRAVIGHRGAHVRALESTTGARVQCAGTTITITGSADAVSAAAGKIEAMRRAEVRLPVEARLLSLLTSPTVVTRAAPEDAASTSTPARCSVLEAVKDAVGCDAVIPLRGEGCVILRGSPSAVQQANMMLRQLMVRNKASAVRVPYRSCLRSALLRRAEGQSRRLLEQFCSGYSSLLRVDLDRDRCLLTVSSFDAEEVNTAAAEMRELLANLESERVRLLTDIAIASIGLLIGPQGSTIRELQATTGTEITVLRDVAEIQVYHAAGDQDALDDAVARIQELLGIKSEENVSGASDDDRGVEQSAETAGVV